MSAAVPLRHAARELGKSETTLRGWVRRGAPTARPGECGRGKGALVDVDALRRWKAAPAKQIGSALPISDLALLLRDYHRAGDHRLVGLKDEPARLLFEALLEYVRGRLTP